LSRLFGGVFQRIKDADNDLRHQPDRVNYAQDVDG
jgi:hypothetical protein